MSDILSDKQIAQALEHARDLIRIGLAVFLGNPCPKDCEIHPGAKGLHLPQRWQNTVPDLSVVDSWKEHQYLCAVGGSILDFLDVDPRNGGQASENGLHAAGTFPNTYGKQLTPSGGHHYLIAPLRCGKGTPVDGIDLQGGKPDGTSAGFVFLSPTTRESKIDGLPRPYTWDTPPDIERLLAEADSDDSGHALAHMLTRPKPQPTTPRPHNTERRIFTRDQATAFCQPHLDALAAATPGTINEKLNTAAKTLSHFGDQFWLQKTAHRLLHETLSRTVYDGATWNADDTINSAYASAGNDWIAVLKEQPTPPGNGEPITDAERDAFGLEQEIQKEMRRIQVRDVAKTRINEQRLAGNPDSLDLPAGFITGAQFLSNIPEETGLWGNADACLWAAGESLMIVGPPGVGKSTLAHLIVWGRLGLLDTVLSYPIQPDEQNVLYLAMDRPQQIARAMQRLVKPEILPILHERLRVRKGPLPIDLTADPGWLLRQARRENIGTIVVDSIKDILPSPSDENAAGLFNRSRQLCLANGIDWIDLHHNRKAGPENQEPKTLDDVYGSRWLTAGTGSVISIFGQPGDIVLSMSQIKTPSGEFTPQKIRITKETGRIEYYEHDSIESVLTSVGKHGATVRDIASQLYGTKNPTLSNKESVRNKLKRMIDKATVERLGGHQASEATYRWSI